MATAPDSLDLLRALALPTSAFQALLDEKHMVRPTEQALQSEISDKRTEIVDLLLFQMQEAV